MITEPRIGGLQASFRTLASGSSREDRYGLDRPEPVSLPEDAWRRAMCSNPWNVALDLAGVPLIHWERQLAFMLREVPLDEVARHLEPALLEMAELTASHTIESTAAHRPAAREVTFSLWFSWWREHFQHWNDPLRAALELLLQTGDACVVAGLLKRLEPAVFADFLIRCSHAHTIVERIAGQSGAHGELFDFVSGAPLKVMGLHDMTGRLWRRYCRSRDISDLPMDPVPDFGVNWHAPFVPELR